MSAPLICKIDFFVAERAYSSEGFAETRNKPNPKLDDEVFNTDFHRLGHGLGACYCKRDDEWQSSHPPSTLILLLMRLHYGENGSVYARPLRLFPYYHLPFSRSRTPFPHTHFRSSFVKGTAYFFLRVYLTLCTPFMSGVFAPLLGWVVMPFPASRGVKRTFIRGVRRRMEGLLGRL